MCNNFKDVESGDQTFLKLETKFSLPILVYSVKRKKEK